MAYVEAHEAEDGSHRWELGVEATWEDVQEGADGRLKLDEIVSAERRNKRRQLHASVGNVKRGMVVKSALDHVSRAIDSPRGHCSRY